MLGSWRMTGSSYRQASPDAELCFCIINWIFLVPHIKIQSLLTQLSSEKERFASWVDRHQHILGLSDTGLGCSLLPSDGDLLKALARHK